MAELGQQITNAQPAGQSASLQNAIRSDLARTIERLNAQSRMDQVVALREEVRAQIGTLDQTEELRSLRLMISTELAQLRQLSVEATAPSATSHATNVRPATEDDPASRSVARRRGSRTANLRGILRAIRQRSDNLELKMASLRQRGKERAVAKTGDPHVVVSGPAALLLGVADLLEEQDAP